MDEPEWALPMNRTELIARIQKLERELWVVADCIFQNVDAAAMRHWAADVKVELKGGDRVPKITAARTLSSSLCTPEGHTIVGRCSNCGHTQYK
jgi:hypothetical protein